LAFGFFFPGRLSFLVPPSGILAGKADDNVQYKEYNDYADKKTIKRIARQVRCAVGAKENQRDCDGGKKR
jgi:hypothetical protein